MTDNVIKNIQELNDKRSKSQILTECLSELKVSRGSIWQLTVSIIVALGLSVYTAFFAETVKSTGIIADIFLDVQLAFFAVIFGAYAIFQALMRDEIVKELIKTNNNILRDGNRTFLNLSIIYVLDIFVTVVVKIVVSICAEDFYIYSILFANITFAVFFFIYCALNFLLMLENTNFIINLYRMFNVYDIYRALDIVDDND